MGPVSAKTYSAVRLSPDGHPPQVEADYGRRAKLWVFGALDPQTGTAFPLVPCADEVVISLAS